MNATFNAATFLDTSRMSSGAVARLGKQDEADSPSRTLVLTRQVQDLRAAAKLFDMRRDNFALGKAATCLDLANKLEQYGSFVSEKQADFAKKLVEWSLPRAQQGSQAAPGAPIATPVVPSPAPAPETRLEALFDVMQNHAKFYVGGLTLARKQGGQLVWIKHADAEKVIGKLDNGVLTLWTRQGVDMDDVRSLLDELNADPLAAARKYGKLSGRCCSCGADLVDPASIERGQGPVCAGKF